MGAISHRTDSAGRRCPACGHPVRSSEQTQCGLCGLRFDDERVTGMDVTPYARAFEYGESGWWRMCEWVWFAGTERLKHLALMRSSAASRRFAVVTTIGLAGGMAVVAATHLGWRQVTDSPAIEPTGSTRPRGTGWLHLAMTPRPLPSNHTPELPVDLWWSPAQSITAGSLGFVTGLAAIGAMVVLTQAGLAVAHQRPYRAERRMTAAVHYGMAWGVMALLGAGLAGLRPLAHVGTIARWRWCPADRGVLLAAVVVLGLAATLWWFWLLRAASTSPARTRGRVTAFAAVMCPLVVGGLGTAWWLGLKAFCDAMFQALGVHF